MKSATIGGLARNFWKMAGAGNDFLVFFGTATVGGREAETIRRLCRRGTGVGADGVLFVSEKESPGPRKEIRVDYFNADGGPARFCANGTRCAARFAVLRGLADEELVADGGVPIKLGSSDSTPVVPIVGGSLLAAALLVGGGLAIDRRRTATS